MSKTTNRWGHPYPEGSDKADAPYFFQKLAESVDNVAMDDQGAFSSRPTSTVESPGKKGRYYYATDKGILYRDTGTSWIEVNPQDPISWYTPKTIAAEQSITSVGSYSTLATADEVPGVVLPTDGLIFVGYHALWKAGSTGTGVRAGLFLGENQVRVGSISVEAQVTNANFSQLSTTIGGLANQNNDAGLVTTGQVVGSTSGGGMVAIFAAAGTYNVSVRYTLSSGSGPAAKSRKLWVYTLGS